MEASALQHAGAAGLHGRSPLLRLQSDERLIVLIRRGNHHAFEALVARYQSRLLAFCRHMLSSREDAEDVLQEVFAAAFNAMLADDREINVRPWLYRIAATARSTTCAARRPSGWTRWTSTCPRADSRRPTRSTSARSSGSHRRRPGPPGAQSTALLLREIDALSYDQIAEAMETTVPSVKSLLVRARVSLAEAAEARLLSCDEVRLELGEVAEGLARTARRYAGTCARATAAPPSASSCARPTARSPRSTPSGPCCCSRRRSSRTSAHRRGRQRSAAAGGAMAGSAGAGAALQVGFGTVASKAVAGLAAAAIVTAGAVEVQHAAKPRADRATTQVAQAAPVQTAVRPAPTAVATAAPVLTSDAPQADAERARRAQGQAHARDRAQDRLRQGDPDLDAGRDHDQHLDLDAYAHPDRRGPRRDTTALPDRHARHRAAR